MDALQIASAYEGEANMVMAVIFDVDGTLVDSVDQHAMSWQTAFHDFGHDIGFAEVRSQIGKGGDQLIPVFLEDGEREEKSAALEKHRSKLLKERYFDTITAFPGVRALFERLRQDGVRIVLASSAKSDELRTYEKLADVQDLIDGEISSSDTKKSKPYPDIFEAALARVPGIGAADILVVGDTPYDAQAAAEAGLRTIGVLSGGFAEADLRAAGCIGVYADPADLLRNYDRSPLRRGPPDADT